MNQFEMVAIIVLVVMIASVLKSRAKYAAQARPIAADPEAALLRDEVRQLKDRIQVLERVITDTHQSASLDRQIDALRER